MNSIYKDIPKDLLHIILEYYGKIKYENGHYVDIIHQLDERYNIITPILSKKINILKSITLYGNSAFYFQFGFDIDNRIGLCYDYGGGYNDKFEICYYDLRHRWGQIKTYL